MRRAKKIVLLLFWLVIATHVYAYLWSTHLDLFPQLPEALGKWIAQLTGTAESEDIERITLYYILIVSFAVVGVATLLGTAGLWAIGKYTKSLTRSERRTDKEGR